MTLAFFHSVLRTLAAIGSRDNEFNGIICTMSRTSFVWRKERSQTGLRAAAHARDVVASPIKSQTPVTVSYLQGSEPRDPHLHPNRPACPRPPPTHQTNRATIRPLITVD